MERIPSNSLSQLLDPINRLYRHRLAKRIAHFLRKTPVNANHVTVAHTLVGILAAFLIYRSEYLFAVLLFEVRTVLDTVDGILARLKNQASPFGRTLDTIGDGITFNSLMLAGALRMIGDFPSYRPSLILIAVFLFALTAAHCGSVYQLMKRKLGSIIMEQVDSVEREWREQGEKIQNDPGAWMARFGFWMDTLTIRFVSEEWYEKIARRRTAGDWESRALQDASTMNELARRTRRREFRNAVRYTAFVSDDNIFAVMSLCFLVLEAFPNGIFPHVHPVLIAFSAGFVYALGALALGLHHLHGFYHGVYRD
jgi:phosphatidylglycerophosphate synthase